MAADLNDVKAWNAAYESIAEKAANPNISPADEVVTFKILGFVAKNLSETIESYRKS